MSKAVPLPTSVEEDKGLGSWKWILRAFDSPPVPLDLSLYLSLPFLFSGLRSKVPQGLFLLFFSFIMASTAFNERVKRR